MKCVCATCGTNVANDTDGYCINDHDDWLEFRDFDIPEHRYVVERAMKNFNLTEGEILQAMIEGRSLKRKITSNEDNLASACTVIAFYLGFQKRKIGNEGIMLHYDIIQQIGKAFCEKYPADFDWEEFYDQGNECWDVICEEFTDQYIKDNDVFIDHKYYDENYHVYVCFGNEFNRGIDEAEECTQEELREIADHFEVKTFKTEEAAKAYMDAVEACSGWLESYTYPKEEYDNFMKLVK